MSYTLMKKPILLLVLSLSLVGCTDEQVAREALNEKRFRSIEFTGYSGFGCPSTLFVHTGFKAKEISGEPVKGVVCSSWFSDEVIVKY